jgi:hypothetical protein
MKTEIYNLFYKHVTRPSHKFWFCSKSICCHANTPWLLRQPNGRDDLIYDPLIKAGVVKGKDKAVPLQALTGPEGSRRLRLPDFMTIGT